MGGKSICFVNLKGGVGKSTLSVAFAEYLAFVKKQRLLFIDGDPQTNSTAMLVGFDQARTLDRKRKTLYDFIRTILGGAKRINISKFIENPVSNITKESEGSISLLGSTIRFADYENLLLKAVANDNLSTGRLHSRVGRGIDKLEAFAVDAYDWVIVDVPPSSGIQARLVMRLARHAAIPTTPDPLSAHGVNFVVDRMRRHQLRTNPLCVIISKFRRQSDTARKFRKAMEGRESPPVDETWPALSQVVVPESATLQRISDFGDPENRPKSFRTKYQDQAGLIAQMSQEILSMVETSNRT
jgi:chromosome partitioning protein